HQARQRADRRPDLPARLLRVVFAARGGAERPADRGGGGGGRGNGSRERPGGGRPPGPRGPPAPPLPRPPARSGGPSPGPRARPATPANTPNPSKAPWYFLGLQEMLVYFDPWLAGVVLPSLIIVGLIAIPYIDKNPKGNGYFTFAERKAEVTIFLFGFAVLWS